MDHRVKHSTVSRAKAKNKWGYTPSWRGQVNLYPFIVYFFGVIANNVSIFILNYFILHSLSYDLRKALSRIPYALLFISSIHFLKCLTASMQATKLALFYA
jgi:hypothetical protein